MGQFGIGQPIKRFEDQRLLKGEGRFHNDVNLLGQTHAVIVRSTHAHARIRSLDTAGALAAPGVVAVFTGADVARDGLGTMQMTLKRKRPDGSPMFSSPHRGLTADRVRYVGDPVAMVIAETAAQARDAAELVRIDYEPLPSVTSTAEAVGGAPVWDECPDNVSNLFESGDRAASDTALAKAHRVIRRRYVISRVHAQFMEPRGALGVWDPARVATRSTPTCSIRTACATRWRATSSRCPSTRFASSPATWAAGSEPRAGSTPSTVSSCGPRERSAGP